MFWHLSLERWKDFQRIKKERKNFYKLKTLLCPQEQKFFLFFSKKFFRFWFWKFIILIIPCQEYGKKLSQTFNELVRNLKESAVCSIAAIMKLLAKIEPSVFFGDFQSNLVFVFDGAVKDENYPPVMTKYFSVLSYLVVYQTESLHQVGQLYCQVNHVSYDEVSHSLSCLLNYAKYCTYILYSVVYKAEPLHQVGQLYCQMNHVSYDEVSHSPYLEDRPWSLERLCRFLLFSLCVEPSQGLSNKFPRSGYRLHYLFYIYIVYCFVFFSMCSTSYFFLCQYNFLVFPIIMDVCQISIFLNGAKTPYTLYRG